MELTLPRSLRLQAIQPSTLRPLRQLLHRFSSSQAQYDGKYDFQVALSGNHLKEFPEEIYNLTNIQILYLWNNSLTEILPSIKNIRELQILYVHDNNLNWLPFELLQLLGRNLVRSMFFPNPFVIPLGATSPSEDQLSSRWDNSTHWRGPFKPFLISRTRTAYLSISGSSVTGWIPAPSQHIRNNTSFRQSASMLGPTILQKLHPPSLFAVALRGCYRSTNLAQLPFLLPSASPPSISRALKMAWRVKAAGGQECSICGGFYIVPRTEWLEWWHDVRIARYESQARSIPFIRRGCSWACTPNEECIDGKADEKDGEIEIATGWRLP